MQDGGLTGRASVRNALLVGATGVAFDLILDIFGGRTLIAGALPFVAVFLPWVGLALLGGAGTVVSYELITPRLAKNQFHKLADDLV